MAALPGEPWRGAAVAEVHVTAVPANRDTAFVMFTAGGVEPTGDQAIWDGNPGSSLTLRFRWRTGGAGSGQLAPTFANVSTRLPGGDIIDTWAVAFPAANVEVTRTFHFDDLPLNGLLGALRSGAIEIYLDWGKIGNPQPWNVDSRGVNNGLLALNSVDFARGYARSPLTLSSHSISNIALAGAEPASFASPDPVFTRLTWSAVTYRSQAQDLSLRRGGGGVSERNEALSNTAVNRDFSWTGTTGTNRRIGNGMFVGSELKDLRVNIAALDFGGDNEYFLATTGHQAGWTRNTELQLVNTNRLTADPRITVAHLLQVNNATFGTPPLVNDVTGHDRLASELGFAASRYRNARGEGINNISVTETLFDNDSLVTPLSQTVTTATKGGEAGWSNAFLPWDSPLPAGEWTHRALVATADLTGLEIGADDTGFTLLAINLALTGVSDFTQISSTAVRVTAALLNTTTLIREIPASARVSVFRHLASTNRIEFLNSDTDNTSAAWTTLAAGGTVTTFSLAAAPSDARLFFKEFSAMGGWGTGVVMLLDVVFSGVHYYSLRPTGVLSTPGVGDPSSTRDGDIWYNAVLGRIRAQQSGIKAAI